jgi:hypothetical protein
LRIRVIALVKNKKLGGAVELFWSQQLKGRVCEPMARDGEIAMLILTDNLTRLIVRLEAADVPFAARLPWNVKGTRRSRSTGQDNCRHPVK